MNEFVFSDFQVDMTESFEREITAEMMDKFREISGDNNPMHCDGDFARENGFDDRLVYGMLTASLYSTLVGVYLPGKYALFQEIETNFRNPVFIGDTLTVTGTVVEIKDKFKRLIIKAVIKNQNGKTVSKATIKAGVLK